MAKYHIKADGTPGVCHAKNGNCPLGGADSHFDTAEAAQAESQKRMEEQFGAIDEPYESGPQFIGAKPTEYDVAVMKDLNTDGLNLVKHEKRGFRPTFEVVNGTESLKFTQETRRYNTDDYLSGQPDETYWEVNDSNGSYSMPSSVLNERLASIKDKKRLEEVTNRAVAQFNKMDYNSAAAQKLQKRIRANEIAGDFVANKELEAGAFSKNETARIKAAESGYHNETLVNDKSSYVRAAVASNGDEALLEKLKDDKSSMVRATVADQSYALEQLSTDEDPMVRAAVAHKGYGSQLKSDPDPRVRAAVASNPASFREWNELSKDPDPMVRFAVVKSINVNDTEDFYSDPDPTIRGYLADNGQNIENFKNDPDQRVREKALKWEQKNK